jgi:hypothetical protein
LATPIIDPWLRFRDDTYLALARITGIHDTMISRRDLEDEIRNYEHIYPAFAGVTQYKLRKGISQAMSAKYELRAPGTLNKVWLIGEQK